MIICILAGVLIGIAERFILSITVEKARHAESSDVSLNIYRGTAVRVFIVISGLALGAGMLNEAMFICLVVSYAITHLAMMFYGLRKSLVCERKPRKEHES